MSYTASKPKIKNTHNADLVNHFYACTRVERMQITFSFSEHSLLLAGNQ